MTIEMNKLSEEQNLQVAKDILKQLGGRLKIMTGAKHIVILNTSEFPHGGLQFKIKTKYYHITVDWDDTYTVKIFSFRSNRKTFEVKKTVHFDQSGFYNDMLMPLIEEKTGMYLSMGTMGR